MIDDELDRILQDIDNEKEFTVPIESNNNFSEILKQDAHESFPETPEIKEEITDELAKFFKSGLISGIHRHIELSKLFKSKLDIAEVPEKVVPIVKKSSYAIMKVLEDIEILTDKFIDEINESNLRRKAVKDFPLYFPDDFPDDNKIDFIVLKDVYIFLSSFNSLVKKDWTELEKHTAIFNFTEGCKSIFSTLNGIIIEGLQLCKTTESLIKIIAQHLGLSEQQFNVSDVELRSKLKYNDFKSYDLKNILNSIIISDVLSQSNDTLDDTTQSKQSSFNNGVVDTYFQSDTEFKSEEEQEGLHDRIQQHISFTIKGTKTWNTREPYILLVDHNVLRNEMNDLEYMVYYTNKKLNDEQIKSELRRALLKVTIDKGDYSILNEYYEFINKKIVWILQESVEYFQVSESEQWLFFYHLGPQTIFRMLIADIQMTGAGYCFSSLDGKKIKKFLPNEYLKKITLEWCENNINNRDLPFDSVNSLDLIRRQIAKKYFSEIDEFIAKIDAYLGKLDPETVKKLDRKSFIKQKALQVYNQKVVLVFNRFVEKTVFK